MSKYDLITSEFALQKAKEYLKDLACGRKEAGNRLLSRVNDIETFANLSEKELIRHLLGTKWPQIFAESQVSGDGSDWSQEELSILGDIGVSTQVTVFDNGLHRNPIIHPKSIQAILMFIPGALLRCSRGVPADWDEVTRHDSLNDTAYIQLYRRRLLPLLLHANSICAAWEKKAFITIPGLGCGQFSGPFHGCLGAKLKLALVDILDSHSSVLTNIKAIYFDPYNECSNDRIEFGHMSLLVRPLTSGNYPKAQLCTPAEYNESGDDFSNCILFSFVAWDHVSWPGNDFYVGSRATDDGVKAAATNLMHCMTGIDGRYDPVSNCYNPPSPFTNWEHVVTDKQIEFGQTAELYVYQQIGCLS